MDTRIKIDNNQWAESQICIVLISNWQNTFSYQNSLTLKWNVNNTASYKQILEYYYYIFMSLTFYKVLHNKHNFLVQ